MLPPFPLTFITFFLYFIPVADAKREQVSLVLASNLRIQKVVGLHLGFLLPPLPPRGGVLPFLSFSFSVSRPFFPFLPLQVLGREFRHAFLSLPDAKTCGQDHIRCSQVRELTR